MYEVQFGVVWVCQCLLVCVVGFCYATLPLRYFYGGRCCFLVLTTTALAENRVKRSKMKGFFNHNKAIFWHFFKKCGDILITVLTSTSVTSLKGNFFWKASQPFKRYFPAGPSSSEMIARPRDTWYQIQVVLEMGKAVFQKLEIFLMCG